MDSTEQLDAITGYKAWVKTAVKCMRSVFLKEPGTHTTYHPFGATSQSFIQGLPGKDAHCKGEVRVNRYASPAPFEVTLSGQLVVDGRDIWDGATALSVCSTLLPGTIMGFDNTQGRLRITYDMRPREEKVPRPLCLHWATEVERIVAWCRRIPPPMRIPGTESTKWTTSFTDSHGTVESALTVLWSDYTNFEVSCATTDGTEWDRHEAEAAFRELFGPRVRFSDTPRVFQAVIPRR